MGEWINKLLQDIKKDKRRFLLVLVLIGILILVIAWPVSDNDNPNTDTGVSLNSENNGGNSQGQWQENNNQSTTGSKNLSAQQTLEEYVAQAEQRLTELLSSIHGAGEVSVMITAHSTRERVIGKDVNETLSKVTENDSSGGTRVTDESSYGESALYGSAVDGQEGADPYIIKELVPQIEGVVVAAAGADDDYIVDEITQAVSVLFDLPVHKIKVVKMES